MGSMYYEIKNKTQNGCNLAFKYTEYPNPDWVNKEMICEVDNKLRFEDSSQEMFTNATLKGNPSNCSGSFYEIIKYQ